MTFDFFSFPVRYEQGELEMREVIEKTRALLLAHTSSTSNRGLHGCLLFGFRCFVPIQYMHLLEPDDNRADTSGENKIGATSDCEDVDDPIKVIGHQQLSANEYASVQLEKTRVREGTVAKSVSQVEGVGVGNSNDDSHKKHEAEPPKKIARI